jgi:hypothetical protein
MSETDGRNRRPIDHPAQLPGKPETFDIASNFSTSSNPSDGWSYGWSTTLGGPLHVYPLTHQPYGGIVAWYDPVLGNEPNVSQNVTNAPAGDADRLTWQPGEVSLSPGPNNEYSDIKWTAPGDGLVAVIGDFTGALNLGGFLSSDVHVLHNGVSLFDGSILSAADTAPFQQAVAVKAGDTIDFEVGTGPDASNVSDTTGLDATIKFLPLHGAVSVATGGNRSSASSWSGGAVPQSDPNLRIAIMPDVQSGDDLQTTGGPFVAKSLDFVSLGLPNTASTLTLFGSSLQVDDIDGTAGAADKVVVGDRISFLVSFISPNPMLHVTHDALNVHFEITGIDTGRFMPAVSGTVQIDHHFDGCTFSLTGAGAGASPDRLILGDPPKRFISNEIDLGAYTRNVGPFPGAPPLLSNENRVELSGVTFDKADFHPTNPNDLVPGGTAVGSVVLSEQGKPVYTLANVHASGYGGGTGGHFYVGMDTASHQDYLGYAPAGRGTA